MKKNQYKSNERKLTAALLKKIFDDEGSRKKLIEIANLQQKERFLNHEGAICRSRVEKLETELAAKYKLSMLMQMQLSLVFMDAEYKMFLEKYGKEVKEKMKMQKK